MSLRKPLKLSVELRSYLSKIGKIGGSRSKRKLSSSDSFKMLALREASRAFKEYKKTCFWSFPNDFQVTQNNIPLISKTLKEQGNRKAFLKAQKIENYLKKASLGATYAIG